MVERARASERRDDGLVDVQPVLDRVSDFAQLLAVGNNEGCAALRGQANDNDQDIANTIGYSYATGQVPCTALSIVGGLIGYAGNDTTVSYSSADEAGNGILAQSGSNSKSRSRTRW